MTVDRQVLRLRKLADPTGADMTGQRLQDETRGTETTLAGGDSDVTPQERASHDEDLHAAVEGVAGLLAGTLDLEGLLIRVAEFAVRAIPGADGAGVAMFDIAHPNTIVASADFVRQVDDIQYRLDEGPCVMAAAEKRTVRSGSLSGDPRWPRFGPRAGRLGVHSALSMPLLAPEGVIGAVNVYARGRDVFGPHATELAELFMQPASVSVNTARVLDHARRKVAQLQNALTSRATIDQAIGIIRSRSGATAEEAFETLKRISQRDNVKLNLVAERVVEEAVRRARARHVQH